MSDDLAITTRGADNGFSLQAAWLGAPTSRHMAASKAVVHLVTPTCTKLIRAHLRDIDRAVTMRELHEATGCEYVEISSVLAKMRTAGHVEASTPVRAADGRPLPRAEWIKTYRWVGPTGSDDPPRKRGRRSDAVEVGDWARRPPGCYQAAMGTTLLAADLPSTSLAR